MELDLQQTLDRLKSIERHARNTEVEVVVDSITEQVEESQQRNESQIEENVIDDLSEGKKNLKELLDKLGIEDSDKQKILDLFDDIKFRTKENMFLNCEDTSWYAVDNKVFQITDIECKDNITKIKIE